MDQPAEPPIPHNPVPQPPPPPPPLPLPSTPTTPITNIANSPTSPTFSYASNEPDIITVTPIPSVSTNTPTPDRDSRRSRTRPELNSVFFEELEDIPAQEAQVRRMSVRRMRVPLSGESLRSLSTTGRGMGSSSIARDSRDSRTLGDWQKEQREWEERAEAVTEAVGEADVKDIGGAGGVVSKGEPGEGVMRNNGNDNNVNGILGVHSIPGNRNRGMEAITGDRNLSWEAGDDANDPNSHTADSRGEWRKFFAWLLTVKGILITIYALNIVAWGGMLFLLLVNAAPAMCHPSCNDTNSPRLIWIEIGSQVLNALFCVTGFGLIPWRFRDLYLLMRYRLNRDSGAWETLRGVHHKWNIWICNPWKVDLVVHLYCFNTYFQAILAGLMWGMTRHTRPAWATGAAVAAACLVAIFAGGIELREGSKVKKARAARRREAGGERGLRMSQRSRATEGDRDEERAVKSKEAGLI